MVERYKLVLQLLSRVFMSQIPSQTEMTIYDFIRNNLKIEYDSFHKEIRLIVINPDTGKEEVINKAWINDLIPL